jgi:hypothetical protein
MEYGRRVAEAPRQRGEPSDVAERVEPGAFRVEPHFYAEARAQRLHPEVRRLLQMPPVEIAGRYADRHPEVDVAYLERILRSRPRFVRWAGCDLLLTRGGPDRHRVLVLETNSCPAGQKSMPEGGGLGPTGGYGELVRQGVLPLVPTRAELPGDLAVLYDKNRMEASGYAAAMAELSGEPVYCVELDARRSTPAVAFDRGVLQVRDASGWRPIRGALRYLTYRPWTSIPARTRTAIVNPMVVALAGGRNKNVAAKAYARANLALRDAHLAIRTPRTFTDVSSADLAARVAELGGRAVIKVPYSNAGQGVFPVASHRDLSAVLGLERAYDLLVVQELIGPAQWHGGHPGDEPLVQVGCRPDPSAEAHAADVRVMICGGPDGYRPLAVYARRARARFGTLAEDGDLAPRLLTNLSAKTAGNAWATETERLIPPGVRFLEILGMGPPDLIEAFVQTVLAARAIDDLAAALVRHDGTLDRAAFAELNPDRRLLAEIPTG